MNSLADMNARRAQWMNEKPQFDGGVELRLAKDDLVIFQFVSNSNDGDRFIKVYKAHKVPSSTKDGRPLQLHKYCPIQNGEPDVECPYCAIGNNTFSERMSIWMSVQNHLHKILPKDKNFPQVQYEDKFYFREDFTPENSFKVWHTSAWRNSPWDDILKLSGLYKGLQNFTAQLAVYNDNLARLYKVYAIPQSAPLAPELYSLAQEKCEPITKLLKDQLASPVTTNPQGAVAPVQPPSGIEAWRPAGASVQQFSINNPVTALPTPPPLPNMPMSEPAAELPQEPTEPAPIEEDTKRPLKQMF